MGESPIWCPADELLSFCKRHNLVAVVVEKKEVRGEPAQSNWSLMVL